MQRRGPSAARSRPQVYGISGIEGSSTGPHLDTVRHYTGHLVAGLGAATRVVRDRDDGKFSSS
jgi:hypothetical protein